MSKRIILPFENNYVILRLLKKEDLWFTRLWRNQERVWFIDAKAVSKEQHYAWFERYEKLDNDFVFIILAKMQDNFLVGQISLYNVDWEKRIAEFGRLIIGPLWVKGQGYAKQATHLLLHYGFMQMNLKTIFLEVKNNNKRAIAVYKSVGFIQIKQEEDLICMSIYNGMEECDGRAACVLPPGRE